MRYKFEPDYKVSPGRTLREWADYTKTDYNSLADNISVSIIGLWLLFAGMVRIDRRMARKLQSATGAPEPFWTALEWYYRNDY